MTYALYPVAPELVPDFWPWVRGFVKNAIDACHGDDTVESQREKIINAKAQLWVIIRDEQFSSTKDIVAAGTTEILTAENGLKFLHIVTLGGSGLVHWGHLWPRMEDFAKAEGCTKIRFHGRQAWRKVMEPRGYRPTSVTFEKDL